MSNDDESLGVAILKGFGKMLKMAMDPENQEKLISTLQKMGDQAAAKAKKSGDPEAIAAAERWNDCYGKKNK